MPPHRYFPGLNALRAYAALSVLIAHVSGNPAMWFGIPENTWRQLTDLFILTGTDAVTLFFVLSGFLITYLLLVEYHDTGTVNAPHFYWRRALRIFPLYFLIIALALTVIPLLGSTPALVPTDHLPALLLFLTPFLYATTEHGFWITNHLWSIGVEEQFYIGWAFAVRPQRILRVLVAVIAGKWLLFFAALALRLDYAADVLTLMRFECMAVGGIGAWAVFAQKRWLLQRLYNVEPVVLLLMLLNIVFMNHEYQFRPPYRDFAWAWVYMALIVIVATKPRPLVGMRWRWGERVGRVSYGVYMYHPLVIYALHLLLFGRVPALLYGVLMYAGAIALTLSIAALSYRHVEQPIMRLRNRVPVVTLSPTG